MSWPQLTTGLSLPQSTTVHVRPTYLSRCAEFTRLSVKPECGSPTTRNATQCLGQLRKERMPSLYYAFFVLTTRLGSLECFSSVIYMTIVACWYTCFQIQTL